MLDCDCAVNTECRHFGLKYMPWHASASFIHSGICCRLLAVGGDRKSSVIMEKYLVRFGCLQLLQIAPSKHPYPEKRRLPQLQLYCFSGFILSVLVVYSFCKLPRASTKAPTPQLQLYWFSGIFFVTSHHAKCPRSELTYLQLFWYTFRAPCQRFTHTHPFTHTKWRLNAVTT